MIIKIDPIKAANIENQQRINLKLSLTQLLVGLVKENWISDSEGNEWLAGTLPIKIVTLIEEFPIEEQFAAKARAISSIIFRLDPLIISLGNLNNKTPVEIDNFFKTYSVV